MYAHNGKISLRQYKRLLVFDVFSVACLSIPYLVTNTTGQDGIPAIIAGLVAALIYLGIITWFLSVIEGDYLSYSRSGVGTIVTFLIGGLYLFKLFASIIFVTKLFAIVINQTLLPDVGSMAIVIPLIIVAGYLASKGLEVRARLSEVLYFIVLVPIFFMFVIGLRQVDLANLTPIGIAPVFSVFKGSIMVFLLFNLLELIVFVKPYLKDQKQGAYDSSNVFSYGAQAIGIVGLFSLLVFVLTVGIMGEKAASNSIWSSITIFQIMEIPGTLINRQDSILLALWMLCIFSVLSGFLYYMSIICRYTFGVKKHTCVLPLLMLVVIVFSIVPMDVELYYVYFIKYMVIVGIPQSIVLPCIVIIANKVRKNPPKVNVKASGMIIALVLGVSCCMLSGCAGQVEIEDREFVQALGIDYEDGTIKVDLILPDFSKVSEDSSTSSDETRKEFAGKDFYAIEESYKLQSSKKLDYSHLKAVVFGKGVYENPEVLQMFINYAEQNYKLSKKTYVFIADQTASDIMEYNKKVDGGIGDYLEKLYKNNLADSEKEEITLGQLMNDKNNLDFCIQIPLLVTQNDNLIIYGEGIIRNSKLSYRITGEDAVYWDILSGYGENSRIFIDDDINNVNYVIRLNQIRQSYNLYARQDKPYYRISIELTGVLEKGIMEDGNISAMEKSHVIREVEAKFNEFLKNKIETQMNVIVKEQGIDYLNIYRQSRYKNRKLFLRYEGNQQGFLQDLQFEVDVNIKIMQ